MPSVCVVCRPTVLFLQGRPQDLSPINMASWSKEALLSFIEVYKSYDCLWRIKSKEYSTQILKDKAYQQVVLFTRQIDSTANREMVTKKINSLRTAFRKELKKVESSKTSGAGEEEVYVPKLWYFNELLFLRDQELPRSSISNIGMDLQLLPCSSQQNEEDIEVNTQDTLSQEDVDNSLEFEVEDSAMGPGLAPLPSGRASTISTASVGSLPAGTSAERITSSSSKSRPGKRKADDELLTLVRDRLQVPDEDEEIEQ